jgi:hypothetical protein
METTSIAGAMPHHSGIESSVESDDEKCGVKSKRGQRERAHLVIGRG